MMIEEMIKEFMKENSSNTGEQSMDGHNIAELTKRQDQYETTKKKSCCN